MFETSTKKHFELNWDDFTDDDGTQERKLSDSPTIDSFLSVYRDSIPKPIKAQGKVFDCATSIGLRNKQEDRIILIPELFDESIAFAGVFDGTSGEEASHFASRHLTEFLLRTSEMKEIMHLVKRKVVSVDSSNKLSMETVALLFDRALGKAYRGLDRDLLAKCEERQLNYVASTAVTALVWNNLLTVAHLGDSRACVFKKLPNSSGYAAEWLTVDHKPNSPNELRRIRKSGGIVSFKGMKPYLREGDYLQRQQRGEKPKQINYSRAFGAMNLKRFGLIAEPEINHFQLTADDRFVILASDGLWDSLQPSAMLSIAMESKKTGRSLAKMIMDKAIEMMPQVNVMDNISVIAISINGDF